MNPQVTAVNELPTESPSSPCNSSDETCSEVSLGSPIKRVASDDSSQIGLTSMSSSAPELEVPGLLTDSSRGTSPLSRSTGTGSRQGGHMRRHGITSRPSQTPLKIPTRRTPNRQKSRSDSFHLKRTALPVGGEGQIANNSNSKQTIAKAKAAQMQAKAKKDHQQLRKARMTSPEVEKQTALPDLTLTTSRSATHKAVTGGSEVRPATSLGNGTRSLGRQFDNAIDDEEEEGNYPLPPSLDTRNSQKKNKRKAFGLKFPPRRTGSDNSESSFSRLAGFFGAKGDSILDSASEASLGSTILKERDDRFRQGVDQSINLMDPSGANYGTSPERGSRSPTRGGRRAKKKRVSVLELMFGDREERGRRPGRQKSFVDIVLGPDPTKPGRTSSGSKDLNKTKEQVAVRKFCAAVVLLFLLASAAVLGGYGAQLWFRSRTSSTNERNQNPSTNQSMASETDFLLPANGTFSATTRSFGSTVLKSKLGGESNTATQMVDSNTTLQVNDEFSEDDALAHLESLLLHYKISTQKDLRNSQSSAYKALRWLGKFRESQDDIDVYDADEHDGDFEIGWKDNQELIEKYALAVFYFCTHHSHSKLDKAGDKQSQESDTANEASPSLRGQQRRRVLTSPSRTSSGEDWMNDDKICEWRGVQCNKENAITHLRLPSSNLHGSLPSELRGLRDLVVLDLSNNHLHGSIPKSIGELSRLTFINLGNNKFSGSIPNLQPLTNLHEINLDMNKLGGTIPSLQGMAKLSSVILSGNRLHGSIPPLTGLGKLKHVDLNSNELTGGVDFEGLTSLDRLEKFQAGSNKLSGTISASIRGMHNLVQLDLSSNSFHGDLPNSIQHLSQLEHMKLNSNQFTGSIPASWSQLNNLQSLILDHNLLESTIPSNLNKMRQLTDLRLNHNGLTGSIPDLGKLTHLVHLHLESNKLSGEVPKSMGNLVGGLKTLLLFHNDIAGDSSFICAEDVSNLQRFAMDCKTEITCDCCLKCY
ncbi:Inherit from bctoNOG: RHS repeat-associated core domain-containing protein [Seminavis robusta]|uniref:Inherit from bctoNOG: RHS repeat-associated core domain-containing protein n=1 Tax=Seminavis robusta TaxID=568900 RepID=A0A9N8HWP3_9STRA|nr:Inherit from bctoNOG: RHS repeat-associated core domain-containing protein [Seminavis robusta]|eukprot:Sro2231_g320070.1 Inherit from bctoNOG: RHS repeat-associated core domain-containing protein (986) ;mRNA; r:12793-16254